MLQPRLHANWAVLISGRGSNLGAALELSEEIAIRVVFSSKADAYGLLRAKRAGVPTRVTPIVPGTRAKIDWSELDRQLRALGVERILLAGFMKVVPADFVDRWTGRIVNLHPSLLPAYPGLDSIDRAYDDGADLGVTIHEVNEEVDGGRIILQRRSLQRHNQQRRSLNANEKHGYAPAIEKDFAEFLVHVDEQRAVKEAIRRWKHVPIPSIA